MQHSLNHSPAALDSEVHPLVSVVIPTLNEAENLPHVIPWIPSWVHEIIIVDGLSTDGTPEVAKSLRHNVRHVQQEGRGKGAALRTGFASVTGDIIVMLDADGSTDPTEIPAFVGALLAGADYAKGSRFLQGGGTADMPLYRKFGNWSFVMLTRILFGGAFSDLCYGYNAFWKHILPQLSLDGSGFEIETMMNIRALRAKLSITEVPSFEARRIYGEGRLRAIPDGWRVLKTIVREWRTHIQVGERSPVEQASQQQPTDDRFFDTLHSLTREAFQIYRTRDRLPSEAYSTIKDKIHKQFSTLLDMDVTSTEARRLRDQYRKFTDDPWAFMDSAAEIVEIAGR